MKQHLINVVPGLIGGRTVQIVDARELHTFLEVGKKFADWINERIQQYQFLEGRDFEIDFPKSGNQTGRGGDRRSKDYRLSLNMAKELAMIERTPKGREARLYFIACEEELVRLKTGAETFGAVPAGNLFDRINHHKLSKLHRLNKNLALAYLVENGITPGYIAGLLHQPESAAPGFVGPAEGDPAPLAELKIKVPECASAEDAECWYLKKEDWERACFGYNPIKTARYLANFGLLRHDEGKLTMKAGAGLFGEGGKRRRLYVYAIRKTLLNDGGNLPVAA